MQQCHARLGWHLWPLTMIQGVTFLFTLDRSLIIHLEIMEGTVKRKRRGGVTAFAEMACMQPAAEKRRNRK